MRERHFVLHGHFYQPPRENPWSGRVPRQPGAAPFHDWNARIDDECYRPNAYGRITDDAHRIVSVVNNFAFLSFNVGPTLMNWLAEHDPMTLERIIQADRDSAARNRGHGNAIAQAYHHAILPLADARDRATEIRWGLADFRHRFGRDAEAMWLPETAANHDVLDDLIDHDLRFVLLAPGQAGRVRPVDGGQWRPVSEADVDCSRPALYRHRDGSGRSLAVFFYDGALAHALSFDGALEGSKALVERVRVAARRSGAGPLVHAATDGETAGHHVAWGDRVLAHALARALPEAGFAVSNYGAILDDLKPRLEVQLSLGPAGEGSSWSCPHGVGRWIRDCGCHVGHQAGWNQEWRAGLRAALNLLRDHARPWFERESEGVFRDPWAARDEYVQLLLDPSDRVRKSFLDRHTRSGVSDSAADRGLALLEMQRHLLLQYTSCGWFFDDIAGIEAMQVLGYAKRALELWSDLGGEPPREAFLDLLSQTRSNDPARGDGARIFTGIADAGSDSSEVEDSGFEEVMGILEGESALVRMSTWLDGNREDESRRLEFERAVETWLVRDEPGNALRAIEAAQDLDFGLYLHRAQEVWLEQAVSFSNASEAQAVGEALGLAPKLCESALKGESWERSTPKEITP